jgi:hypothetical protein
MAMYATKADGGGSTRASDNKNNIGGNSIIDRILPDCYLYISHLDNEFQYWQLPGYPDEVTDQMDSAFTPTTALGRSAPVYTFSSSGPRTVQISLSFHRDMFEDINQFHINEFNDRTYRDGDDLCEHFIHALQAIAVPKYNLNNKAIEPPLVAIRLGREVFIKGVVTSGIGVTYGKPILVNEKYATMKISFTIAEVDPYDSTTVFTNGSFRGLTQTLRTGMHY